MIKRYRSDSPLKKTLKEEKLDWLEEELGIEFPDALFASLAAKLTLDEITQFRNLVKEAKRGAGTG